MASASGNDGMTDLMREALGGSVDAVSRLIAEGDVDLNKKNKHGRGKTALMYAAEEGHVEVISVLIAKGADIDVQNQYGMTAQMLAFQAKQMDAWSLLLEKGADVDLENNNGRSMLALAVDDGRDEVVSQLIVGRTDLETWAWRAARLGNFKTMALLANNGANVKDHQDENGRTALMYAILLGAAADSSVVDLLFATGSCGDLDAQTKTGWTALMFAVVRGRKQFVTLLLEKGRATSLGFQDKAGRTALMFAARSGYLEIVNILLEKGAEVNTKDEADRTALMFAARCGYLEIVNVLLEKGTEVSTKDEDGKTALDFANDGNHDDIVSVLLKRAGANAVHSNRPFCRPHYDVNYVKESNKKLFIGNGTLRLHLDRVNTIKGHFEKVLALCASPDEYRIASGSADYTVKIWDTETGVLLQTLEEHTGGVNAVCMSHDGTVISGSNDKTVKVWDAETGLLLKNLRGHTGFVTYVCVSKDGTKIVSCSKDKTVKIWDAQTGDLLRTLEAHTAGVNSVCMSPDGTKIASGSSDKTVKIWNAETGSLLKVLKAQGHSGSVTSLFMSPDGTKIVSGSKDKTVKIWDTATGFLLRTLEVHSGVNCVCMSADGTKVVSGTQNKIISVWNAQTGEQLQPLEGHTSEVLAVCMFSSSARIVSSSSDTTIKIWDVETRMRSKTLTRKEGPSVRSQSVCMSSDGNTVVSGFEDGTISIWDAKSGSLVTHPSIRAQDGLTSVNISADGTIVASRSGYNHAPIVEIWDVQSGLRLNSFEEKHKIGVAWCVSHDGLSLLSLCRTQDKALRIWETRTGSLLKTIPKDQRVSASSMCISRDGTRICFWADYTEPTIQIWDVKAGSLLTTIYVGQHCDSQKVTTTACLTADGSRLISGSDDKTVKIWDTEAGSLLKTLKGHLGEVSSVCVSRDGTRAFSCSKEDCTVRVWDVETGVLLQTFMAHHVTSWCVSDDGTLFSFGLKSGGVQVVDIVSGSSKLPRSFSRTKFEAVTSNGIIDGWTNIPRSVKKFDMTCDADNPAAAFNVLLENPGLAFLESSEEGQLFIFNAIERKLPFVLIKGLLLHDPRKIASKSKTNSRLLEMLDKVYNNKVHAAFILDLLSKRDDDALMNSDEDWHDFGGKYNPVWTTIVDWEAQNHAVQLKIVTKYLNGKAINEIRTLAYMKDRYGRTVIDMASDEIKKLIYSRLIFKGRYDIQEGVPIHISATACVVCATDTRPEIEYRRFFISNSTAMENELPVSESSFDSELETSDDSAYAPSIGNSVEGAQHEPSSPADASCSSEESDNDDYGGGGSDEGSADDSAYEPSIDNSSAEGAQQERSPVDAYRSYESDNDDDGGSNEESADDDSVSEQSGENIDYDEECTPRPLSPPVMMNFDQFVNAVKRLGLLYSFEEGYLKKQFELFDRDKSGTMDEDEFVRYCVDAYGKTRRVVIKFMSMKDQFDREVSTRKGGGLDSAYVVTIVDSFQGLFGDSILQKDARLKGYNFGIVMPAADRNLDVIYRQERPDADVDHDKVMLMMKGLAGCLQHLHKQHIVHGDVKMMNVVRVGEELLLIDMDAAVNTGEDTYQPFVGAKFSSGVLPPEMFAPLNREEKKKFDAYWAAEKASNTELWQKIKPVSSYSIKNDSVVVKTFACCFAEGTKQEVPRDIDSLPYELVRASPAIDIWSFGCILYTMLTGSSLLKVNRDDDLEAEAKVQIVKWTDSVIKKLIVWKIKDTVAADLLVQLLKVNPDERLQSMEEVLAHPFFFNRGGGSNVSAAQLQQVVDQGREQINLLKNINKRTEAIESRSIVLENLADNVLLQIKKTERVLLKGIFDATEVQVPTCFIILNQKLDDPDDPKESVQRAHSWLNRLSSFGSAVSKTLDTLSDTCGTAVGILNKAAEGDISGAISSSSNVFNVIQGEPFYFYLVDQYTMQPVHDPKGVYPILIKTPADFVPKLMPLMKFGMKAMTAVKSASHVAQCFGFPVPMISDSVIGCVTKAVGTLDSKSSVDEYDLLQASVTKMACGGASYSSPNDVRGAGLRDLIRFFEQHDPENRFAGLRRVLTSDGATCYWVSDKSAELMELASSDAHGGVNWMEEKVQELEEEIRILKLENDRLKFHGVATGAIAGAGGGAVTTSATSITAAAAVAFPTAAGGTAGVFTSGVIDSGAVPPNGSGSSSAGGDEISTEIKRAVDQNGEQQEGEEPPVKRQRTWPGFLWFSNK